MGKESVRNQLHVFLDDVTEYAFEEFKPLNVVGLGFLPGSSFWNSVSKTLLGSMMRSEINMIKISLQNEFNLIVDYAEDEIDGEGDVEDYREMFLNYDVFYQNYEGDDKDELEEDLMQRLREVGEDMSPIIEVGKEDFWESLTDAYDKSEAEELFRYHFSFTDKIVEKYGDDIKLTFKLGPIGINYTNEALRVLPKAEGFLREEIMEKVDEVYEDELEKENRKLRQEIEELEERIEELEEENQRLKEEGGGEEGDEAGGDGTETEEAEN